MESYSGIVETSKDAIILLEAARIGLIPTINRRLKDKERKLIKEGDVFIWGEKEAKMRRWTDGRSWSASRVTGNFLTYREMEYQFKGEEFNVEGRFKSLNFRHRPKGLIKQSFSLTRKDGVKMHLISYTTNQSFANAKLLNKTPSKDASLAHIVIPQELYSITNQIPEPEDNTTPLNAESDFFPSTISSSNLSSPQSPSIPISPESDLTYRISSNPVSFDSNPRVVLPDSPTIFPKFNISQNSTEIQLPPLLHNLGGFQNDENHNQGPRNISSSYDAMTLNALNRMTMEF